MGRNHRSLIISLLLLAVSLVTVTVVLADYLGPDRTTTVVIWRRLRCSYLAEHDEPGPGGYYACTLTQYYPPSAGCPSTGSRTSFFNSSACTGWPDSCSSSWPCSISLSSSTEGCSDGESGCEGSTQTVNQPPATISGSISCSTPGSNGWCQSAASLNLTGTEPLSGYSITALEGTRNGDTFACAGSSCNVDLLEGQNDFTYWALSSWGDSSTMGSTSGKVDTQPPAINGTLSGTSGDNGWYVSDVTVSASASDSMSGLQSFEINVDGGGYQTYAETTLGEGTHTIELRAVDYAGHVSQVSQSFSVDKTLPQLALSGGGSFCPRCGDILALSYDVQDALSGISGWTLSASGAVIASSSAAETGIVDWDGSGLGGGTHTLTLSVRDAAGNTAETSIIITLNTPRPEPTRARLIILPTRTPTPRPVVPALAPPEPGLAQREPSRFTFESVPPEPQRALVPPAQSINSTQPASPQATAAPVLWGGAAAGLIGAAMVVVMEAQRKRKEDEARQIAEMHRLNAEMRAREKQEALLIAQRREMSEQAALLAAMAAGEASQGKLEDEEQAWLEKKLARDESMFGRGMGTAKEIDQFDLAALAASIGADRVRREYEEPHPGKVPGLAMPAKQPIKSNSLEDEKPLWKKIIDDVKSFLGAMITVGNVNSSNPNIIPPLTPERIKDDEVVKVGSPPSNPEPLEEGRMIKNGYSTTSKTPTKVEPLTESEQRPSVLPYISQSGRPPWVSPLEWLHMPAEDRQAVEADARQLWDKLVLTVTTMVTQAYSSIPKRPPSFDPEELRFMFKDRQSVSARVDTILAGLVPLWEMGPMAVKWVLQEAILESAAGTNSIPPSKTLVDVYQKNSPGGALVRMLWVSDVKGMNFRKAPNASKHTYGLEYRSIVEWDGQIRQDANGEVWYHVGDSIQWGWVSGEGLAPYRPSDEKWTFESTKTPPPPMDPLVTTLGYGVEVDPGAWSVYWLDSEQPPGAAQYVNVKKILAAAGISKEDLSGYKSQPYVNRCGEFVIARALNLPLEVVFCAANDAFQDVLQADGTTSSDQLEGLLEDLGASAYVRSDAKSNLDALVNDAAQGKAVIINVNVIGGGKYAPYEEDDKVIAHWAQLVSEKDGVFQVYNSLTNTVQEWSEDELIDAMTGTAIVTED